MPSLEEVLAALGVRVTPGSGRQVVADEYAGPEGPGITVLERSGEDPKEPLRFVLRIDPMKPAATEALAAEAQRLRRDLVAQGGQAAGAQATRQTETHLGEHPAIEVAGAPGREGTTDVILVRAWDQLYRITRAGGGEYTSEPPRVSLGDMLTFEKPASAKEALGMPALEASIRPPDTASRRLEVENYPPRDSQGSRGITGGGAPAPPAAPDEGRPRPPFGPLRALPNCIDYAGPQPLQTPWSSASQSPAGVGTAIAGPNHYQQGLHQGCSRPFGSNDAHALDFGFSSGGEILPNAAGTVRFAGWAGGGWGGYGRIVIVDIGGGYSTLAAHLSGIAVTAGQQVNLSTVLGWAGGSGWGRDNFWGVHLHNVIYRNATILTNVDQMGRGGIFGGQGVEPRNVRFFGNGGGVIDRITSGQLLSW